MFRFPYEPSSGSRSQCLAKITGMVPANLLTCFVASAMAAHSNLYTVCVCVARCANSGFLTSLLLLPFGVSELTQKSPIFSAHSSCKGGTQWHVLLLSSSTGTNNSRYNFPVWLRFLNSNHVEQQLCIFIVNFCGVEKGNIHP
jgi:hypothetical protein